MKLQNNKILTLVNLGLLQTTEHDVPAEDAYKSYKFRKAIEKANKAIEEKRQELVKTAGIEDGAKFDERRKELAAKTRSEKEQKELDELNEKLKKFEELHNELMKDESDLGENIIPMSWAGFHALSNENKRTAVQIPTGEKNEDGSPKMATQFVDVFRACEGLLDGVLFKGDE